MDIIYSKSRDKYYNKIKQKDDCTFCILKETILLQNDSAFAIMNKYPYNVGHMMIVPKRHVTRYSELKTKEISSIFKLAQDCIKVLDLELKASGYNIGINEGENSGGSIKHLHVHVIPRWKGDTGFITTSANTRVMSKTPEQVAKLILKRIKVYL